MPGRISMDPSSATEAQNLKRKRTEQDDGENDRPAPRALSAMSQSAAQANHGPNGAPQNGPSAIGDEALQMAGEDPEGATQLAHSEGPPRLDRSWRESANNKSLGVLMDRLAQTCYMDLNSTITQMSDIAVPQDAPQVNGSITNGSQLDSSDPSLAKKRLLLTFADDQRDRFTKALVLSDWARREDEIANLIDIKVWQEKQRAYAQSTARAIGEAKRSMVGFKVCAPNIEGAMELLATGKSSKLPDLGYIPPKRLTAKLLLRTMKNMNVALATRLNLHEELPPRMQDFSIANGRATFRVASEFEVDISVADEDPAAPIYFIDMRLAFQPTYDLVDERARGFLERKVNEALAARGLKGCYDFLHNFALTHKINVLRSQASELLRGKWFDCIQVQHMRRNLIVQYWVDLPGPKNWIEIGISSGKVDNPNSRTPPTPVIESRWFRKGLEITSEQIEFDWQDLKMEKCLMLIIDKHCRGKLAQIANGLHALAPQSTVLEVKLKESNEVQGHRLLSLRLPCLRESLEVRLEPVTGQISITPATTATKECARHLNTDPNIDPAQALAYLLCAVVQEQIGQQAKLLGWTPVQNITGGRAHFGDDVWNCAVYSCSRGWGTEWALGVTSGLHGLRWWTVRLEKAKPEAAAARGVVYAHELSIADSLDSAFRPSQPTLIKLEKLAVAEISVTVLSEHLRSLGIAHDVERIASRNHALLDDPRPLSINPAVVVRFSQLMNPGRRDSTWKPWAAEYLRVTHHGIESDFAEPSSIPAPVRHDLRLTLVRGKFNHLQKHLTRTRDQHIALNDSGGLAVRLLSPFGEPFVDQIKRRLLSVERLDRQVAFLRKLQMSCSVITLARLEFTYNASPPLSAQLSFASDGQLPIRVTFSPADTNPHQKLRAMLELALNKAGEDSFNIFAHLLLLTLPLLQAFERLQAVDPTKQTIAIRARSSTWYAVTYKAPLPQYAFQIRARCKIQGGKTLVKWHLEDGRSKTKSEGFADDFLGALKELWQSKGDRWFGVGQGAIAGPQGIADVLERLDGVVRRFPVAQAAAMPTQPASIGDPSQEHHAADRTTNKSPHPKAVVEAPAPPPSQPMDVITID